MQAVKALFRDKLVELESQRRLAVHPAKAPGGPLEVKGHIRVNLVPLPNRRLHDRAGSSLPSRPAKIPQSRGRDFNLDAQKRWVIKDGVG